MDACKVLFRRKLEYIEKLHYDEALHMAVVELANCLTGYAMTLAEYYPRGKERNLKIITEEMADPIYQCFSTLVKGESDYTPGNIKSACRHLQPAATLELAYTLARRPKARLRHFAKIVCAKALKYIKL
ncbi:MAG: hypothetical protein NC333_05865 [Terasakiella sp.]|nr:hypothetical protein [Terasakiella sp.]